jgi:hypothetical protein
MKISLDKSFQYNDAQFKILNDILTSIVLWCSKASNNEIDDFCCDSLVSAKRFKREIWLGKGLNEL